MSGIFLRLQLFLVSYVPLLVIFAVRALPDHDFRYSTLWPSAVWLSAALLGIFSALWIIQQASDITAVPIIIESAEDQGSNAAAYLATYIFPFILIGQSSWQTWAAYAVYVVVLLVVTTRSTLILINPTLYLLGRHVVLVDHQRASGSATSTRVRSLLICRRVPRVGDTVNANVIADGYIQV